MKKITKLFLAMVTCVALLACKPKDELNGKKLGNSNNQVHLNFKDGKVFWNEGYFHLSGKYKNAEKGKGYSLEIDGLFGKVYFELEPSEDGYVLKDNYEDTYDGMKFTVVKND